jgi:hypothetical protein
MPASAKVLLFMFSIVLVLGIIFGLAFHAGTPRNSAEQPVVDDDQLSATDSDSPMRNESAFLDESYPITSDHSDSSSGIKRGDERYSIKVKVNDTFAISIALPHYPNVATIRSVATLETELRTLQLENYYQANESDCSEFSAFVEWWLEDHGVHAYIVEGRIAAHPAIVVGNVVYEADDGSPHAWVAAELEGDSLLIESTGVYLVPDELEPYYLEEHRFEDVQALVTSYREEGYDVQSVLREYDWWEVLPVEFNDSL